MNNDFRSARIMESVIIKSLLISFFVYAICAIFKNIGDYKLAMTSIANGVFFSIFYIYTNQTSFGSPAVFPNLFKLNIAFCLYDLVICFYISIVYSFGLVHNVLFNSKMNVFIISCFVSMVLDCVLIYFLFRFNKIKKRLVQLNLRLHEIENSQN